MTEKDKNKVSMLPFEGAIKKIETLVKGLQFINETADSNAARDLADEALDEVYEAAEHLKKSKNIMSGNPADEPSLDLLFLKVQESLHEVQVNIANNFATEEDSQKLSDLARAKILLADAVEIIERADILAQHRMKGTKQPRVILISMGEYFSFDDASTTKRYCGITD